MLIVIVIIGGFLGINYFTMKENKEVYRLKVVDRLNGSRRYLSFVDGINDTFSLSEHVNSAILYNNLREALYIKNRFEHENAQFIIEKQVYSIWGSSWAEYITTEIGNSSHK